MEKITFFIAAFVLMSSAAFSQWSEQTSGQTTLFYSVSGADDNNAWIRSRGQGSADN
jgi:hypothetical protein